MQFSFLCCCQKKKKAHLTQWIKMSAFGQPLGRWLHSYQSNSHAAAPICFDWWPHGDSPRGWLKVSLLCTDLETFSSEYVESFLAAFYFHPACSFFSVLFSHFYIHPDIDVTVLPISIKWCPLGKNRVTNLLFLSPNLWKLGADLHT